MSKCITTDLNGYLVDTPNLYPNCNTGDSVLLSQDEFFQINSLLTGNIDYLSMGITPVDILFVMSWGMGVVLTLWSIGYAVGVAKNVISRL